MTETATKTPIEDIVHDAIECMEAGHGMRLDAKYSTMNVGAEGTAEIASRLRSYDFMKAALENIAGNTCSDLDCREAALVAKSVLMRPEA